MRLRRALTPLAVVAAIASAGLELPAQKKCDDCPWDRLVTFYNARVTVPRPTDARAIVKWLQLVHFGWGVRSATDEDPKRDCLILRAGSLGEVLSGDREGFSFPISGPYDGADYMLTARVDGAPGAYRGTATLEDAKTREIIRTASVSFSDPALEDPMELGTRAAARFSSYFDTIREFQKRKRDETNDMIQPRLDITPGKTLVKTGETIDVDVEAWDCDGARGEHPLKRRPIALEATGGRFDKTTVDTDDKGRARVRFTAGSSRGSALLTAVVDGQLVTHTRFAQSKSAVVAIERGDEMWAFDLQMETITKEQDSKSNDPATEFREEFSEIVQAGFSGVVRRPASMKEIAFYSSEDQKSPGAPVALHSNVTGSMMRNTHSVTRRGGKITDGHITSEHAEGRLATGPDDVPNLRFEYLPETRAFSADFRFDVVMRGSRHGKFWRTADLPEHWEDFAESYESPSPAHIFNSCDSSDPNTSVTATEDSVTVTCTMTSSDEGQQTNGVIRIRMRRLSSRQ